jgi:catechol 2,3-dioxygenase-like lactoylglutathione lyase family enzyme
MLQVQHFCYEVSNLEKSLKFYNEILGLEIISKTEDPVHNESFAFLKCENCWLELIQIYDIKDREKYYKQPEIKPPYAPHIAFVTNDMDAFMKKVEANKILVANGPNVNEGVRWVYLADPDHNIIEFVEGM